MNVVIKILGMVITDQNIFSKTLFLEVLPGYLTGVVSALFVPSIYYLEFEGPNLLSITDTYHLLCAGSPFLLFKCVYVACTLTLTIIYLNTHTLDLLNEKALRSLPG